MRSSDDPISFPNRISLLMVAPRGVSRKLTEEIGS